MRNFMSLNVKSKESADSCDCLALGEVMLRFDPGVQRINKANNFDVHVGGGEYNVVQGLSSCFGLNTAILTSLVDNEVGQLIASMIASSGVDRRWINWQDFDGIGQQARNGIYFMERGFGVRGANAVMDRGHSALSKLQVSDIDWQKIFQQIQPRWFHVGGVMAGLSEQSPDVVEAAMLAAKAVGAIVSYDLNYRHSLWANRGGKEAAAVIDSRLIKHADVLFGVNNLKGNIQSLDVDVFSQALLETKQRYPNLKSIVTTMRIVKDASQNLWGGVCLHDGVISAGSHQHDLAIFDRVGGGDAFAAGYIYGMLQGLSAQQSIDMAIAHGALVMSTAGDNSSASLKEVLSLAAGGDASAKR